MALDALIFDLDGTLLDTNAAHADAWAAGLAYHGYVIPTDRIGPEIGKGGDLLLPALLGEAAAERDGDPIRAAVQDRFRQLARSRAFAVLDGAVPLLEALRGRGLRLALATSATSDDLDAMLTSAGVDLRSHVDAVTTRSDVETSKPAPDVVLAAARKLGVSPAQCAMVGDTPYDAMAARRAGAVTLGVLTSGLDAPEVLRERLVTAGARHIVPTLRAALDDLDETLRLLSPTSLRLTIETQERLMDAALEVAREGMRRGEAPIGCVIADASGTIVGRGFNQLQATRNRTAHAEMVAFADAAKRVSGDARDLLLVSTLEPCVMCTGAAMVSGVDTILFGLRAPADSGTGRVTPPTSPESIMPRIVGDVRAAESRALFEEWLRSGPPEEQAEYGRQLLALTGPGGAN